MTDSLLRKHRRHAMIANALFAAMLTPADPLSMVLMAVPLVILYEISILIAKKTNPAPLPEEDERPRETAADEERDL